MLQKKTFFVIPGYKHRPNDKAYKEIATILRGLGFEPVLVNIPWKGSTISENTEYFLKEFRKVNRKKKYILGFSYGAMIAFLASTKVSVSGLILCSLSPYFKEDLPKIKKMTTRLQKLRYQDFSKLHCESLAKQIKTEKLMMLYGTREERSLKKRVREAFEQISTTQKYLMQIRKTEHNIRDKRYINTILQVIKTLN